jgi:transcription initiation factor IIF auxiliary subunit
MTLQLKQSTRYQGKDWWNWSVWLEGTKTELKAVDHVVYTLHASFPEPVRSIKTRKNGFRLDSAGWGEFRIFLEIVRVDGKSAKRTHWLELTYPQDTKPARAAKKSAAKRRVALKGPQESEVKLESNAAKTRQSIYISSGAADAEFARKLREQLAERGVKVSSAQDVSAGLPFAQGIQKAIQGADATVFVFSGAPNLWSKLEMDYAQAKKPKTIIPVLVGESTQLPTSFMELSSVRVASDKDVGPATNEILKAANIFTK